MSYAQPIPSTGTAGSVLPCLDGFVGLRRLEVDQPASGLYLEDLKGITLEQLEKTSEAEQASFLEVWKIIQRRAAVAFRQDFQIAYGSKAQLRAASDIERIGHIAVPVQGNAASTGLAGILMEVDESYYLGIYIYRVRLFVQAAGTTTLRILDSYDGTELLAQTWELMAGWNELAINRQLLTQGKGTQLFVGYETTGLATVLSTTQQDNYGGCSTATCCDGRLVDVFAGTYADGELMCTRQALVASGNSYGLQVDYDLRCSLDPLICQMRDVLANAYYLLLGREAMDQRLNSTRQNKFTVDGKEQQQALRDDFEAKYQAALKQAIETIGIPADYCFCRNHQTSGVYAI